MTLPAPSPAAPPAAPEWAEVTQRLKTEALALGFTLVGVAAARPGRRLAAYQAWIAAQMHGEMAYLARPDRQARRADLEVILPGVTSLVCVGLDYSSPPLPPAVTADPSRGRISNYAWGADYHTVMTPRLEALGRWLAQTTRQPVRHKVYVDTGAILERDHAETAGLGFTGKNTLLIHPRRGSYLFLGELLTTAPLTPDPAPRTMPDCGRCQRCLTACPTAAFPQPYVLDARRCISYLTIELRSAIPLELRPLLGNWVYGCDVCQVVCPFNRFASHSGDDAFRPATYDHAAPPLLALLALDEAAFEARFAGTPVRRLGRPGLVRNACVAAGNWGAAQAAPALSRLALHDTEPLVRQHAAWALGRLAQAAGRPALRAALAIETHPDVRQEIACALATATSSVSGESCD